MLEKLKNIKSVEDKPHPFSEQPAVNPSHIAVIMDGNGRWAKSVGLPRIEGHRKGAQALETVVEACVKSKINYLTVFAFSSENWRRPADEVDGLIGLLRLYLQKKINKLVKNNVRLNVIGDIKAFPDDVVKLIESALEQTKDGTAMTLTVALNYGSRAEIVRATQKIAARVESGCIKIDDIDESMFSNFLMTADMPNPDVLVRTSGEQRISNYLLWQISYAELIFVEKHWPDFGADDIAMIIEEFKGRNRRYGGL